MVRRKIMELDENKIKEILINHGLSTRRSETIAKDLAQRNLFEIETEKKKNEIKNISEVIKE
jgi:predicted transcriptional regulator